MTSNRLPILADEIAEAHACCEEATGKAVEQTIRAGRALIEAKGLVGHGGWEGWLRTNVPAIAVRTCQRYMRAAKNAGKSDSVSFSSLRELIRPRAEPGGTAPWEPLIPCGHPIGRIEWYRRAADTFGLCDRCRSIVPPPPGMRLENETEIPAKVTLPLFFHVARLPMATPPEEIARGMTPAECAEAADGIDALRLWLIETAVILAERREEYARERGRSEEAEECARERARLGEKLRLLKAAADGRE